MILRKLTVFMALAGALLSGTTAMASSAASAISPDKALKLLLDGNKKFAASGSLENLKKKSKPEIRKNLAKGQHPYAIVLTCSDSRLPAEIIFDKGLGEIFVARVAGNIAPAEVLGSIEYGIEHLGAPLVLVLGHSKCGAVKATYDTHKAGAVATVEPNINSLVKAIDPAVTAALAHNPKADVEECVAENIKLVAEKLETDSKIIKEFKEAGKIKIVKGKYDLSTGIVTILP